MLELDHLLTRWLDTRYASASDEEKAAFRTLLQVPHKELVGYLLGDGIPVAEGLDEIVRQVRGGAHT